MAQNFAFLTLWLFTKVKEDLSERFTLYQEIGFYSFKKHFIYTIYQSLLTGIQKELFLSSLAPLMQFEVLGPWNTNRNMPAM